MNAEEHGNDDPRQKYKGRGPDAAQIRAVEDNLGVSAVRHSLPHGTTGKGSRTLPIYIPSRWRGLGWAAVHGLLYDSSWLQPSQSANYSLASVLL